MGSAITSTWGLRSSLGGRPCSLTLLVWRTGDAARWNKRLQKHKRWTGGRQAPWPCHGVAWSYGSISITGDRKSVRAKSGLESHSFYYHINDGKIVPQRNAIANIIGIWTAGFCFLFWRKFYVCHYLYGLIILLLRYYCSTGNTVDACKCTQRTWSSLSSQLPY